METDPTRSEEAGDAQDQSVEDFREEIENDPSTAHEGETEETDLDRLRGG